MCVCVHAFMHVWVWVWQDNNCEEGGHYAGIPIKPSAASSQVCGFSLVHQCMCVWSSSICEEGGLYAGIPIKPSAASPRVCGCSRIHMCACFCVCMCAPVAWCARVSFFLWHLASNSHFFCAPLNSNPRGQQEAAASFVSHVLCVFSPPLILTGPALRSRHHLPRTPFREQRAGRPTHPTLSR